MGFAGLFSSRATTPVITLSFVSKSEDADNGFGSDFRQIGQVAPDAAKSAVRAWRHCPERSRAEIDGVSKVSFCAWLVKSDEDIRDAQDLIWSSYVERNAFNVWQTSFVDSTNAACMYESRRHEALSCIGREEDGPEAVDVRRFGGQEHLIQAGAIDALSRLAAPPAIVSHCTTGAHPARGAGIVREDVAQRLTSMCELTMKSLRNQLAQIKCDQRDLFLLNDMTREAEKERARGGANVPLRLAIRGDKCVLKPAKSRSRHTMPTQRARREAANLALLVGLAPNAEVTLDTLRARGFGIQENTFVLNDAMLKSTAGGERVSWFFNRTREMQVAKRDAEAVLLKLTDTLAETSRVKAPPQALVDNDIYEAFSASADGLNGGLAAGLTSVKRSDSPRSDVSETSYRRAPSVDHDTFSCSTPEPVRELAAMLREYECESADFRSNLESAPPAASASAGLVRQHRVMDLTIEEAEEQSDDEGGSLSPVCDAVASPRQSVSSASDNEWSWHPDPQVDVRRDLAERKMNGGIEWSRAGRMASPPPSVTVPVVLPRRQVSQRGVNEPGATGAARVERTGGTSVESTDESFFEIPPPLPTSAPPDTE